MENQFTKKVCPNPWEIFFFHPLSIWKLNLKGIKKQNIRQIWRNKLCNLKLFIHWGEKMQFFHIIGALYDDTRPTVVTGCWPTVFPITEPSVIQYWFVGRQGLSARVYGTIVAPSLSQGYEIKPGTGELFIWLMFRWLVNVRHVHTKLENFCFVFFWLKKKFNKKSGCELLP